MGRGAKPAGVRVARIGTLVVLCGAVAACSASDKLRESRYSPKVVADGEPVPKGGGSYKVGGAYTVNGNTYQPSENRSYRAEGMASWYGADFHGRQTSNGEVYDMHAISAAHPTLPMPSYVRVTNLDNHRSIIVRVNDRGPYARNRIIDVSIGAAQALKFYEKGIARVRVEYVGRASLDGSDDRMLLATLREGSPAPAPSRVMIASAMPLLPDLGQARGREVRTEAMRAPPQAKSTAQAAIAPQPVANRVPATAAAYAPVGDDGAIALMSGRGLY
jgi:rare lipoprotein A